MTPIWKSSIDMMENKYFSKGGFSNKTEAEQNSAKIARKVLNPDMPDLRKKVLVLFIKKRKRHLFINSIQKLYGVLYGVLYVIHLNNMTGLL